MIITKLSLTDGDAAHPGEQGLFCAWAGPMLMRDDDTLKCNVAFRCLGPSMSWSLVSCYITLPKTTFEFDFNDFLNL